MHGQIHVDYDVTAFLAMGLAALASIILGFVWYSPKVFGTKWAEAIGIDINTKPGSGEMAKASGLMILGTVFTTFVLFTTMLAFVPDSWLENGDTLTYGMAMTGAFFVWLGFFVPVQFSRITWEQGKNILLLINGAYYLVMLAVQGAIFAAFLG